jgi:hypothetical protein
MTFALLCGVIELAISYTTSARCCSSKHPISGTKNLNLESSFSFLACKVIKLEN